MITKKSSFLRVVVLLSLVVLVATPLLAKKKPYELFPQFMTQKDSIGKIYLVGDIVHFKDIKGKIDKVNIPNNLELWGIFQTVLLEKLKAKNFIVEKTFLTSMGLYLEAKDNVYLVKTTTEEDMDNEKLPQTTAPFFIAPEVEANAILKENLQKLYKTLDGYAKKDPSEVNLLLPEATAVAANSGCETLIVVNILARSISTGKLIGGAAVGGLIGMAIMGPNKGITYNIYIIDAKSGELIWSEKLEDNFAIVKKAVMKKVAKTITKKIPAKQKG